MEFEIETRNCFACGREFRCTTTSLQKFHSRVCEESGDKWKGQSTKKDQKQLLQLSEPKLKKLNDEDEKKRLRERFETQVANFPVKTVKIDSKLQQAREERLKRKQSFSPKLMPLSRPKEKNAELPGELNVKNIEMPTMLERARSMPPTRLSLIDRETKEERELRMPPTNTKEITTQNIKSDLSPSSLPAVRRETQLEDLPQLSEDLKRETSDSMNLLTHTSIELFNLMKGLNKPLENQEIRLHDVDRVRVAAECGKQIISTMRMKLDVLKFAKELRDTKKP